ncbi:unnamed protein product [Polarella glacialis]|uniref:Uncharacterized protein n=1 Tax=Polarella glacialis TaxID=89957 RepID=A0A813EZR2_POLGL|nr:unnamed protein product [Polarella glacialis]
MPKVSFHQQSSAQHAEVFKSPKMFWVLLPGIELPLQYQKPQECSWPGSNCPRTSCMLLACEEVNMLESEEGLHCTKQCQMILAGLEPAIFASEDHRLIH